MSKTVGVSGLQARTCIPSFMKIVHAFNCRDKCLKQTNSQKYTINKYIDRSTVKLKLRELSSLVQRVWMGNSQSSLCDLVTNAISKLPTDISFHLSELKTLQQLFLLYFLEKTKLSKFFLTKEF